MQITQKKMSNRHLFTFNDESLNFAYSDKSGSGDVDIGGGQAPSMNVSVAGSGDINFRGSAGSVKARIAGSGDVRVKSVSGPVQKTVLGSGSVIIG